jgi:2-polyprenyl-3-methyl-5-hydroxy-6-metoxy-1,4-benzoquinol methylase
MSASIVLIVSLVALLLLCVWLPASEGVASQWMYQTESKWDKEWSSGAWEYMERNAIERSRVAVIGGVFAEMYAPFNGSVLDIGCGEGAIADFLVDGQKQHYVGIDLSKEAIKLAKSKRGPPLKFVHAAAHEFTSHHKYDVIIFSDVLYYVEHEKVIPQYANYLNPNGIMVISIFHQTDKLMYENIFTFARTHLIQVDETDVSGYTKKKKDAKPERTAFHIEVYKLRS